MQSFKGNENIIDNEAPFSKSWLVFSNDIIEEFFKPISKDFRKDFIKNIA